MKTKQFILDVPDLIELMKDGWERTELRAWGVHAGTIETLREVASIVEELSETNAYGLKLQSIHQRLAEILKAIYRDGFIKLT